MARIQMGMLECSTRFVILKKKSLLAMGITSINVSLLVLTLYHSYLYKMLKLRKAGSDLLLHLKFLMLNFTLSDVNFVTLACLILFPIFCQFESVSVSAHVPVSFDHAYICKHFICFL